MLPEEHTMSEYVERIKAKAKTLKRTVVLPEGSDPRPVQAAAALMKEELLAEVVLLGDIDKTNALAKEAGVSLENVSLVDPNTVAEQDKYISMLYEARKHKGMTEDKAKEMLLSNPLYMGAAMVGDGRADGMVAGCINATANVIRSALYLVGLEDGINTLSSFFIFVHPDTSLFGGDGVFVYADCGVVPDPTAEQLADIAMSTAKSYKQLVADDPKVAMLSFSTKGSGKHPIVDKVVEGTKILESRNPSFPFDGELQFDAAFVPSVAERKAPGSKLKGDANIFIFPDLNAGNICYKATQRLANCTALGPILQGVKKPVNDLSRGATAQDIVEVAVITALQV